MEIITQIMNIENILEEKNNCHLFCIWKYKSFTELFIKKFNKKCDGVKATIHWIKMNYPLVKVPSVRQVFRWINTKIWIIKKAIV